MSAKGRLPEADSPSRDRRNAPLTNLAQLFVEWTSRHPLTVIIAFGFLTALAGLYVVRHFSINTDVNALISADLPWRQRELAMRRLFRKARKGSSRSSMPPRRNWLTPLRPA